MEVANMKSNKKTAHDNSIKKTWTIIIIALVLIAIIGIVIFFLIRKPKVTYEYYINNNKSSVIGNNITNYECSNGTTLDIDKDNKTIPHGLVLDNPIDEEDIRIREGAENLR